MDTTRVVRIKPRGAAGAALALAAALLVGCGEGTVTSGDAAAPATFSVHPGVEQVTVTGAPPKATLVLRDASGTRLLGLVSDELGQASFAYIPDDFLVHETGSGASLPSNRGHTLKRGRYTVRNESARPVEESAPFLVLGRDDHPPTGLYESQALGAGFTYIEMRDGVKLSAMVRLPQGRPPYPTVVEYSGYGPSNPGGEEPGSMIAGLLGYATVGVNMRGTGCSGGVFDLFNPAQQADGYDIIEAVARQPWVLNHKVGMVGLSYSGISQLYVASTRPPSLAAITPLSVIEDPWREQWPGGVYNSGFTKQWLAERDREASAGGSSWVQRRINGGDTLCAEHQRLRSQNPNFEELARALEFYPPDADDRRLSRLVRAVEVPVYLTGAWQDEQTGSLFANMLGDFARAAQTKFIMYNGRHPDGYSPTVLTRWFEFLEFYVARRIPRLDPLVRALAPGLLQDTFRVPGLTFEPDRFANVATYAEALRAYEAEPAVRVLFEVGGVPGKVPGAPIARYEASFPSWPPPDALPRMWYLGSGGALLDAPPADAGTDRYRHDPAAGAVTYSSTGAYDFIYPQIRFNWPPLADGFGLHYVSEPLAADTVVAGDGGYVNLWFASEATDANVEVTLTEVQPDGTEVIVQSGVLRVGHRRIDDSRSNTFRIDYTYHEADFRALTPGQFIEVKVPLRPFAHAFRAGSRLRLIIDTPGRDSPLWAYENPGYGDDVFHRVAHGPQRVSFVLLPVIGSVTPPAGYPPCPSLRGQICRPYVALANQPG